MKLYKDIGNDSGVLAYEYGEDWISVQFKYGGVYTYRASRIGAAHIAIMKQLADSGDGLNGYINSNPIIKKGYDPR
jgi:hypothetical protein